MKKILSIFMIFLLIMSTIGPLPIVTVHAAYFPGSVEGSSVEGEGNKGTVTVTMFEPGYTLVLYNKSTGGAVGQSIVSYTVNTPVQFNDVGLGNYYVKAMPNPNTGGEAIDSVEVKVQVRPIALSVGENESAHIFSPAKNPYELVVKNITGDTVRLYNNDSKEITKELQVTGSKMVTFEGIPASKKYQVTQLINGVESAPSEYITVRPKPVTIEKKNDSGSYNNAGEILVRGITPGNSLELYSSTDENVPFRTANNILTSEYTFKELPAGSYTARQIENDVPSDPKKDPTRVTILNERSPSITLEKETNYELHYEIDSDNNIIEKKYSEPGYIAIDKNGKSYPAQTGDKFFCSITIVDTETQCESLIMSVKITSDIPGGSGTTPPGKYIITYTATDGFDRNLTTSVTRNVTVFPNQVKLSKLDTENYSSDPTKKTGQITVHGVYANATLKLYQDSSDGNPIEIATYPRINEKDYTIPNIPVGKNYFIIQEVNGVQGKPSERIEIKDTTPPELKLNGESPITLEVGDRYVDSGATATDNIDTPAELNIVSTGSVNTSVPGIYTISYNVKDKAGNSATPIHRSLIVKPRPVTAIGGIATTGEIGVKDIFPGVVDQKTTLKLYKFETDSNGSGDFKELTSRELTNKELTYVLRKYGPGRYYVTQTVNGQESRQSNIVEIVDTDRPYITLNGLETIQIILGEPFEPYYDGDDFIDPGVNADDYLEANSLILKAKMIGPNNTQIGTIKEVTGKEIQFPSTKLQVPGLYTITYSATAPRGSKADEKQRIIKLAPPKVTGVTAGKAGEGKINVINGLFEYTATTVTLYNTYGQKMDSKIINNSKDALFEGVPAGLGYYVTQTVNGIESSPSVAVNVSLYSEAPVTAFISSFEFPSLKAVGLIDHTAGTITVTVPIGTAVTRLAPVIKTNNDPVNTVNLSPLSGVTQNFSSPVTYKVTTGIGNEIITKTYTVTVVQATASSELWKDVVQKNIVIGTNSHYTLTSDETAASSEKGIAFISSNLSVFVPASNVKESKVPTLSIQQPAVNTIYTSSDPIWTRSIANPVHIEWGGDSSFHQPIEVELNNASGKVFSKLVRTANNQLYATVQPSYTVSGKTVGLVSEPGLYALIDNVAKPYIQELGNGRYRIHSMSDGSTIYYTTNSQHISYEKPANSASGNYLLDKSGINLEQWNAYTEYETLTVTGNELYAVAVKDQVISPVSTFQLTAYSPWSKEIKQVEANKIWSVKFNAKVEKKALYNNSIYVTDDTTGATVPTTLIIGADGQSIDVVPASPYDRNKYYTLWVTKQIKGHTINNQFLVRPTKLTFMVK